MSQNLRLNAGALASDCYPASPQSLYNEMFERGSALMGDITGIIISDSQPDAEDRDKAWLKTSAGAPVFPYPAIWFNGAWIIPHPDAPSGDTIRLYSGSSSDITTYDGGDGGTLGDASGPMWEIYTAAAGRFPIAPGTLPSTTVIAVGDTGGEEKHVLTEAEGGVGSHTHAFGLTNPGNDDAYFNKGGVTTVSSYTGYYITGSNGNIQSNQTTADLFTSPPNNGAGVTSAGHNNMPPYIGVYLIRRTARKYYRAS